MSTQQVDESEPFDPDEITYPAPPAFWRSVLAVLPFVLLILFVACGVLTWLGSFVLVPRPIQQ